jgi:hypothetical protein
MCVPCPLFRDPARVICRDISTMLHPQDVKSFIMEVVEETKIILEPFMNARENVDVQVTHFYDILIPFNCLCNT